MIHQGIIYIISAPSGAGKSSLIQVFLKNQILCNTQASISYTTRSMRPREKHGQHYFFISIEEFENMIYEKAFLEYAQVFGNYYGTSRKTIEQAINNGIDVFLDIDWQGAQQIRNKIPDTRSIFILPPSKEELNLRLRNRSQDSEEVISKRMAQAVVEMTHSSEYDYLIINNDFNAALLDLKTIIQAERLRLEYQKLKYDKLINKLLTD